MSNVIILAGPSGAGKSTLARKLGGTIVSADAYFMRDGEYVFDPKQLAQAYAACLRNFVCMVQEGMSVIVDNTNTTIAEIAPYAAIAQAYERPVTVLVVESEATAEELARRNAHGVPAHVIEEQRRRLFDAAEEWPMFWPRRVAFMSERRVLINTTWTEESARDAFPLGVPVELVDGQLAIAVEYRNVKRGHPFPSDVRDVYGYVVRL